MAAHPAMSAALRKPLTTTAQERVGAVLKNGGLAVDATVGNGHDTLFLAAAVGAAGHVYGFDIQPEALDKTCTRLTEHGLLDRVTLTLAGHQDMAEELPADTHGAITAVMFNLGYLPGSDKQRITRPESSVRAMASAIRLLARDGIMTVLAYRGHGGGREEYEAVLQWLGSVDPGSFRVERLESPGPVLFIISKT